MWQSIHPVTILSLYTYNNTLFLLAWVGNILVDTSAVQRQKMIAQLQPILPQHNQFIVFSVNKIRWNLLNH